MSSFYLLQIFFHDSARRGGGVAIPWVYSTSYILHLYNTFTERKKNNARTMYRHECEPLSLILIMVTHNAIWVLCLFCEVGSINICFHENIYTSSKKCHLSLQGQS